MALQVITMIPLQCFVFVRAATAAEAATTTSLSFIKTSAAAVVRRKKNPVRFFWTSWNQQKDQQRQRDQGVGPVTLEYQRRVKEGGDGNCNGNTSLQPDEDQLALCAKLDSLYHSLSASSTVTNRSSTRPMMTMMIPDEHLEAAAWYYNAPSSSSSLLKLSPRTKLFLSSLSPSSSGGTSKSIYDTKSIVYATAHSFLSSTLLSSSDRSGKNGIYIHGSVGVGKSMLMDLFHSICTTGLVLSSASSNDDDDSTSTNANGINSIETFTYEPINVRCKRYHFHEFMIHVHQQIHSFKSSNPKNDPIPFVASQIAKDARLLCFDEMQITDIADAMIIKRILTLLIDLGVMIVTTSNRPPSGLYEGGINRSVFLPLVDTLMEKLIVVEMTGTHDYRMQNEKQTETHELSLSSPESSIKDQENSRMILPTYICTSTMTDVDDATKILNDWFSTGGRGGEFSTSTSPSCLSSLTAREEHLPVAMGRTIHVKRSNDSCAWFDFQELCHQPLGAADYIAIAERYDIVIVENVPQLSGHCYNEARRFVIFIDALYEARTKVVISSDVQADELFMGFDATAETKDGDEEIAIAGSGDTFVIGEGGSSSSSSTTMIRANNSDDPVEWSATGRIGVSLAQLSAVKEVSFSFKRAESRIAEMSSARWGKGAE